MDNFNGLTIDENLIAELNIENIRSAQVWNYKKVRK